MTCVLDLPGNSSPNAEDNKGLQRHKFIFFRYQSEDDVTRTIGKFRSVLCYLMPTKHWGREREVLYSPTIRLCSASLCISHRLKITLQGMKVSTSRVIFKLLRTFLFKKLCCVQFRVFVYVKIWKQGIVHGNSVITGNLFAYKCKV